MELSRYLSSAISVCGLKLHKLREEPPKNDRPVQEGVPEPKIVKEGWLFKRGEHIRTWRRRYFVLRNDGSLLGFKIRPEPGLYPKPSNNFTVEGCQVLCQERPRAFSFILRGLRRTQEIERVFAARSNRERASWITAIQRVEREQQKVSPVTQPISKPQRISLRDAPRRDHSVKLTLEDFELMKVLGRGSFGKVVLSREISSDQLCAIKIVKKQKDSRTISKNDAAQALTETLVLRSTNHPFLVGLKYSFQTVDRLCFVMEFVNGGDLFFHLSRARTFSEEMTRFYAAEIALALGYLHNRGVIHRDLKLENLLLDREGHIKITDFGLCKSGMELGTTTRTFCGSPPYMAPEIWSRNGYGHAVDWWSLGVTMYQMMSGRLPFCDRNSMCESIIGAEVKFTFELSSDAKALLQGLLAKNPGERLGGGKRGVKDIKEHAFFRTISWKKLLAKKLTPPFMPGVTSGTDTSHFDSQFTSESVQLTPTNTRKRGAFSSGCTEVEQSYFRQFSYYGNS